MPNSKDPRTAKAELSEHPQSPVQDVVAWRSIWRVIGAILITLSLLWALWQMRPLVGIILISVFLALALEPGVRWLTARYQWRRGAAFGVIYAAGLVFLIVMVVVLIPAISQFTNEIGEQGPVWVTDLNQWSTDVFGVVIVDPDVADDGVEGLVIYIRDWADDSLGGLTGVASAGVTLLFSFSTIAMFTFYFVADSDRITRTVLSWFRPESQERIGWTLDEAIKQTGGYFYSRTLLMLINGVGFFITMVVVGVPVSMSIPLSVFGAFVSVFIPVIGTYLGAAIPILVTLAVEGLGAALILLGYVLLYQLVENSWLSPKLSSETMSLSGGMAFGAALAGGSIAGPMGAFLALPTAALITSFITNYATTYEVAYESQPDSPDDQDDDKALQ
ncbi:MAG: AI-2E family transporter [Actinobacteria bacterium]|nr:AI-2E family transporter [Actinomycetota bacterium]